MVRFTKDFILYISFKLPFALIAFVLYIHFDFSLEFDTIVH